MAFKLTIQERGDPGSEYVRSFLGERVVIGRARSSDVCLPDMAVSTRHAEIRIKEGGYAVVDLGSVNGTSVNGKPLKPHRPKPLEVGDRIAIANFRIGFQPGATQAGNETRELSSDQARQMLARILARAGADVEDESRERSLWAIYEAPEEETASFGFVADADPEPRADRPADPVRAEAPLPVGPADPLAGEEPSAPLRPESLAPAPRDPGGDLGLILIGGIIVVLAVIGLIYLLK